MDVSNLPSATDVALYTLRHVSRADLVDPQRLKAYKKIFLGTSIESQAKKLQCSYASMMKGQQDLRRVICRVIALLTHRIDVEFRYAAQGTLLELRKEPELRGYIVAIADAMISHHQSFVFVPGEQQRLVGFIHGARLGTRHPLRSVKWLSAMYGILRGSEPDEVAKSLKCPEAMMKKQLRTIIKTLRDCATECDVTFPSTLDPVKLSTQPEIRSYLRSIVRELLETHEEKKKHPVVVQPVQPAPEPTPVALPLPTPTPQPMLSPPAPLVPDRAIPDGPTWRSDPGMVADPVAVAKRLFEKFMRPWLTQPEVRRQRVLGLRVLLETLQGLPLNRVAMRSSLSNLECSAYVANTFSGLCWFMAREQIRLPEFRKLEDIDKRPAQLQFFIRLAQELITQLETAAKSTRW